MTYSSYGNVDCRYTLPEGYVRTYDNVGTLKKLQCDYHPALFDLYKEKGYWKPEKGYIVAKKDLQKITKYKEDKKSKAELKRQRAIDKAKKDFNRVLLALYTVNKEAKRQRDIKYRIADSVYGELRYRWDKLAHHQISQAKENVEYLYCLKEKGIEKILSEKKYEKVEIHEVNGTEMGFVQCGDFSFHFTKSLLDEHHIQAPITEVIDEWISSEKKIKGMSLATATTILNNII